MTNEATRLDACPFCRGSCAVTKGYSTSELPWSDDGGNFFRVYCSKCQARQLFHRTEAEAIEAWNRRAALAQPAVSEDALDAARYRWLREHSYVYAACSLNFGAGCGQTMPELLDEAIEAQIAMSTPSQENPQ